MSKKKEAQRADSIEQEAPKPVVKKSSKTEIIESYLDMKYEFRYNTIKCKPEMLNLTAGDKDFHPLDKYKLNSLKRELDTNGIESSTNALKELFESDFAPAINPIQAYFEELEPYKKGEPDYIAQLAGTVRVINSDKWPDYLRKWLVAVVANAMTNVGCQNHVMLVLTGAQGKFKTTWLNNLCPKKLELYNYTGKIDLTNKDCLTYIAEYLIVNIDDQLKQLNKKDENDLKALITAPSVKYRRPYDPYITEYPHLASFCASINGNDFLTDPTGSRRFMPVEVANIDIAAAQAMDMSKVFAQAYALFKSGFKYYFDDTEIEELHSHNQNFHVVSEEQQLLNEFFRVPATRDKATHHLTNAMIKDYLEKNSRAKIITKKLGEALTILGFEKWQQSIDNVREWKYAVIMRSDEERRERNENKGIEITEDLPF